MGNSIITNIMSGWISHGWPKRKKKNIESCMTYSLGSMGAFCRRVAARQIFQNTRSTATAKSKASATSGQRRPAASEVEYTA